MLANGFLNDASFIYSSEYRMDMLEVDVLDIGYRRVWFKLYHCQSKAILTFA